MDTIRHTATIVSILLLSVVVYTRCLTPAPGESSCVSLDGQFVYDCIARECLKCGTPVENSTTVVGDTRIGFGLDGLPANCSFDPATSTLTCRPDTSTCTIQTCSDPCDICIAHYSKLPGDPLDGDAWTFSSQCFGLDAHAGSPDCISNGIFHADRCFGRQEFDAGQRESVLNGEMGLISLGCRCYELNCTAEMGEIKFEFPESPTFVNPPEDTTTPGEAASTLPSYAIVIIIAATLIGIFIMACLIFGMAVCIRQILKVSRSARTQRSPGVHRHDDHLNDQSWQLLNQVGQGRYGYVYRAKYCDDIVAVKIFSHHSRSAWETECALNSMESTAHENIVEFVTKESRGAGISLQLVIITRYYPLGSLNQFLRKHVVSLQQANVMISSVAKGLAHLHAEYYTNSGGIMTEKYAVAHRDMKSANVLVKNENGDCVIGDLGFAMILDPSLDSKQLASTGQVGTFRYMAPEVLDTRVHLLDLQSFKQIDVYAFSLIMWEVMSRCCIFSAEDVAEYQLPFEDLAGLRPSLDAMKDIVVSNKLRPSLPSIWTNDEHLKELYETVVECWDEDPEARLSAANVVYRMEEFTKEMLGINTELDCTPSSSGGGSSVNHYGNAMATQQSSNTIPMGQPIGECSQSSPPPYSPTDPNSSKNAGGGLCHSVQPPAYNSTTFSNGGSAVMVGGGGGYDQPIRTLRNSACSEGGAINMSVYSRHEPLSVRNSLILGRAGGERRQERERETEFGASVEGRGASLLYEHGHIDELQGENDGSSVDNVTSGNGSGLDSEDFNLNSDSGVQNLHSSSTTSVSMNSSSNNPISSDSSRSRESVVSNLSDELFSKHQLPESSTDTLDLDTQCLPAAAVSNYGGAPEIINSVGELSDRVVPTVENSGNSVSTVTSV